MSGVLISWAQCCLLVAILLLMSLMRTTDGRVLALGWLVRSLSYGLLHTPCQLAVPSSMVWLSLSLLCLFAGLVLPVLGSAHDFGLVYLNICGVTLVLQGWGDRRWGHSLQLPSLVSEKGTGSLVHLPVSSRDLWVQPTAHTQGVMAFSPWVSL